MRRNISYRRLQRLAEMAATKDPKIMKQLIELAMHWENDVGFIIDKAFDLPHPPSTWKDLPKWLRKWNKAAKKIVGF
jgi:hypothetical protein